MKFFKYIALAVLASTISANAVQSQTVGKLKKTDTVVIAVDDLIDETELNAALATYATKTWAATTATNAANHAASSKVTKVTGAKSGNVVKFASNGEVADSNLKVDDLLTAADLTDYAKKDEMKVEPVTGDTTKKKITLKNDLSQEVLVAHQDISGKADVSDLTAHTGNTAIHITAAERTAWDDKYDLPSGGITTADLSSGVVASLGKADTALQASDIADKLDRPIDTNNGCIPVWTAEGQLQDSGKSPDDFATAAQGAKADNAVQKQTLTPLTDNDDIDTLYARVNQIIKVLKNETVTP